MNVSKNIQVFKPLHHLIGILVSAFTRDRTLHNGHAVAEQVVSEISIFGRSASEVEAAGTGGRDHRLE